MNARQAKVILRGYRPSGEDDDEREVQAALKVASKTPALEEDFRNQLAFDQALAKGLDTDLPPDLVVALEEPAKRLERKPPRRFSFRDPAMMAVGLAFLMFVGVIVWILLGKMGSFAGMEEAVEIVQQGDSARPDQYEPIDIKAGALPDWFDLKDFDGFVVPHGMENAPAVGVRTFEFNDVPVAVAAIDQPKALCYVFDANPFGIALHEGEWKVLDYGDKPKHGLAVTQLGPKAFVIALRDGDKAAMQKYIESLAHAP